MRKKYFEIVCDACKLAINHYPDTSPHDKQLKIDKIIVWDKKHFCDETCKNKYYALEVQNEK